MKAFITIICILCGWLLLNLLGAVSLGESAGTRGFGGFPMADRQQLYDYLTSRGFARVPTTGTVEIFQGSSRGSRPFLVTVWFQPGENYGINVSTSYKFRGFTRRVEDSTKKAKEFAEDLDHWLSEQRMKSMGARL